MTWSLIALTHRFLANDPMAILHGSKVAGWPPH